MSARSITASPSTWEQALALAEHLAADWGEFHEGHNNTMRKRHGAFADCIDVRVRAGVVVVLCRTLSARDWAQSTGAVGRYRCAVIFEEKRQ